MLAEINKLLPKYLSWSTSYQKSYVLTYHNKTYYYSSFQIAKVTKKSKYAETYVLRNTNRKSYWASREIQQKNNVSVKGALLSVTDIVLNSCASCLENRHVLNKVIKNKCSHCQTLNPKRIKDLNV